MIEKLNCRMIDWTLLRADLCSPVSGWVIHHQVVHQVELSVEPTKKRHTSSTTASLINNIMFSKSQKKKRKEATVSSLWSELTWRSIFSCIKPECRWRLRLWAAPVRWQYQHTPHLNLEKRLWWASGDSVSKYGWHSLIETSREACFFYYSDACPLIWVSRRRARVSPSRGSGCLSILDHTCDQIPGNGTELTDSAGRTQCVVTSVGILKGDEGGRWTSC